MKVSRFLRIVRLGQEMGHARTRARALARCSPQVQALWALRFGSLALARCCAGCARPRRAPLCSPSLRPSSLAPAEAAMLSSPSSSWRMFLDPC